ncbi:hypothetical protein Syun_001702 [Stephania yunnanensis]|uniref:Uncharacterized protein n=1 Tax=Stephania yunnanensis TaxID=152371 RepID=A0AAP0LG74_9MAGN
MTDIRDGGDIGANGSQPPSTSADDYQRLFDRITRIETTQGTTTSRPRAPAPLVPYPRVDLVVQHPPELPIAVRCRRAGRVKRRFATTSRPAAYLCIDILITTTHRAHKTERDQSIHQSMKMQPQIFLKSSSSSMEGFVPPNYEFQLGRLAAHHHQRHRELCGRVIFSDPCAQCGNKKRRLLTFEAETISASAIPTPPPPSSPADIFRRWNSCPSTNSPATAPLPTPDPASMKRSLSDVTPAPAE